MQLSLSSSAMSTFSAASSCSPIAVFFSSLSAISKSSSTMKELPSPCWLCTVMVPPIRVTRFLVMDIPRPVPPYFCPVTALSCSKGRNSRSINSLLIPTPSSLTVKRSRTFPSFFRSCLISRLIFPPSGVNLSALDSRFSRIWFSRRESPFRTVSVRSTRGMVNFSPLAAAWG